MSHDQTYHFLIGATIPAALTPLFLHTDGLAYPVSTLAPAQLRSFVGLSQTKIIYSDSSPRTVNVYREGDLIPVEGLAIGGEYHLGLTGPALLGSISLSAWSMRVGIARTPTRLLYHRGDIAPVPQLLGLLGGGMNWQNFTATDGQTTFTLSTPHSAVAFVLYGGAVLPAGAGLYTWISGNDVVLSFPAVVGAEVSIALL